MFCNLQLTFRAFVSMQNVKDEKFLKALGQHIRNLRLQKGLTQLELGVKMNNHAEQVSRIERGELNVSACTLHIIAKSLEITLSELFDFEIPSNQKSKK